MASADLREDLSCSICLNIYTDPVTLKCGHNFCRECIDRVLDTQEASGGYSCPECREEFRKHPALRKNITLCNITEKMSPAQTPQGPAGTFCTYCIHAHVPAAKSCLHCEAHLCADHLKIHSKSPEHVLLDPSTSMENRKCSIHREPLRYFCIKDKVCICVSCSLAGQHRGHQLDMLDEASRKKKEGDLRNVSEKLISKFQEVKEKIDGLQEQWRKSQEKTAELKKRATAAFGDLRSFVEHLEKKVLAEISQQEEQGSQSVSNLIRELEAKRDELARKVLHVENLFDVVDPLIVLQDLETSRSDFCDMKSIDDMNVDITHKKVYAADELDESPITAKVQTLSLILKDLKCGVTWEPTKLSLTKNTACYCIKVSDDPKSLSGSIGGCDYKLAMSTGSFSSGTHYWEVEVGGLGSVGLCYASLINEKYNIEKNRQSWWLRKSRCNDWSSIIYFTTIHDSYESRLPTNPSTNRFRIYLNYDAGQISFYELSTPIRHLHTFTAKFTEPLHAAFYGYNTTFKIN